MAANDIIAIVISIDETGIETPLISESVNQTFIRADEHSDGIKVGMFTEALPVGTRRNYKFWFPDTYILDIMANVSAGAYALAPRIPDSLGYNTFTQYKYGISLRANFPTNTIPDQHQIFRSVKHWRADSGTINSLAHSSTSTKYKKFSLKAARTPHQMIVANFRSASSWTTGQKALLTQIVNVATDGGYAQNFYFFPVLPTTTADDDHYLKHSASDLAIAAASRSSAPIDERLESGPDDDYAAYGWGGWGFGYGTRQRRYG